MHFRPRPTAVSRTRILAYSSRGHALSARIVVTDRTKRRNCSSTGQPLKITRGSGLGAAGGERRRTEAPSCQLFVASADRRHRRSFLAPRPEGTRSVAASLDYYCYYYYFYERARDFGAPKRL